MNTRMPIQRSRSDASKRQAASRSRDGGGRFTSITDEMPTSGRNDALLSAQGQVAKNFQNKRLAFGSGWLYPQIAWATYSQNGVVSHIIQRIATLMLSKPWTYEGADIKYSWASVLAELDRIGLSPALRSAVIWMMVFGGAGLVIDVDDVFQPWSEPLDPEKVRKIKGVFPKSALSLKPWPYDKNWETCTHFEDQYTSDPKRRRIHRSRVIPIVAGDVPPDLGHWGTQVYNTYTGWPPSWIERIYTSLCEWKDADKNVGTIIRTMSLLVMMLKGFRKAMTAPANAPEVQELEAMLETVAENLDNEGLLTLDFGDRLEEISRNTTGLDALLQQKKGTFVANTGVPKELVLMEAVGNLGTNSAPIDAYHELVGGMREDTLIIPVMRLTKLQLLVEKRNEPSKDVPTYFRIKFGPLAEQTGKEQAEQRDKEASARERDLKAGTPKEVIQGDPSLNVYPDMARWREEQLEQQEKAKKQAESNPPVEEDQPPEGELESARSIGSRLNTGPGTILAMAKAGEIKGHRVRGRWKFHWPTVWSAIQGSNVVEETEEQLEQDRRTDRFDTGLGLSTSTSFGSVFGASWSMREIFAVLEVVAPTMMPVLVTGETGTGKEGIARGLHDLSSRGSFVAINCGALPYDPADVLAHLEQALSEAKGGTLFLDEIGELPGAGQGAMLRALSGAEDVRLVSATWQEFEPPWFRRDLKTRLAQVEVEVPPLRERDGDVLEIALLFYAAYVKKAGWPVVEGPFAPDALVAIGLYGWPGNVRELKNAVELGALFAGSGERIAAENLGLDLSR